ncbi:MAG TPA: ABC transporter ATP-binding protein [Ignavibacteria bacterium]|nr:ABC transporter ATP-binding protein [Bacteroidota bacterium]HRI83924.1 ABC transporter ATP-binding protein [Ignavibacteria bacterium]HRJ98507.1 ABC transporter ATP-binding protein [Ignavibacteria bacterium]
MSTVIKVEDISKLYRLGIISSKSIVQDLNRFIARITKKEDPLSKIGEINDRTSGVKTDYVWALKNINFEVKDGEILGIIGKNGAGKSTLLKILSRVTSPTKGIIKIKGRVASLLEVGTGFHQELTGRENIFLNGSILGMTKAEIRSKFDEIVEFSGIGSYIDTPVKRYSSGMYVRLAFAVAAHLDPEILIVDEVLAVGDAEFQKKCLGKMQNVSEKEGRTVLFVSHNMAIMSKLCNSVIVLKNGQVDFPKGPTADGIQHYILDRKEKAEINIAERTDRIGEGKIRLIKFEMMNEKNEKIDVAISGQKIKFRVHYKCIKNPDPKNITAGIAISRSDGFLVTVLGNGISSNAFDSISQEGYFTCVLDKLPVTSGLYLLNLIVYQNGIRQDWIQEAVTITVEDGDFYNTGKIVPSTHRSVLLEHKWYLND